MELILNPTSSRPTSARRGQRALLLVALIFTVPLGAVSNPSAAHARSCPTVSGYIYHDANDNGIRDPGEAALGGGAMELLTATGAVAATTVAAGDGYYEFFFDGTLTAPEESTSVSFAIPPMVTNWADNGQVAPFDSALGTLVAVDITQTATITSSIEAESLDSEKTTITATVSGEVTVGVGSDVALAVQQTC